MTDLAADLARQAYLVEYLTPRHERPIPFCPHTPTPRQREFLSLDTLEGLYGGEVGGGKSDVLLMGALLYADVPGYSAIILRRTYQDLSLPGAVMTRSHEWLSGTKASWNGTEKRWTFPVGAFLQFGYCETPNDIYRYQGAEFQYEGIDELTQWPEAPVRYLFSRLRRPKEGPLASVPLRFRGATNPGGVGHEWVKKRYVEPGDRKRPFIRSRLSDNPFLDAEAYRDALALLDEETRQQLEHGLWVQDRRGLVYRFDRKRNAVASMPSRKGWHVVLAIDLGASEREPTTAFVAVWWHPHDPCTYIERAWKEAGLIPASIAERSKAYAAHVEEQGAVLDAIVMDEGALGKGYGGEMRQRYGLAARPAQKRDKLGNRKLLNGSLERGEVLLVGDACEPLAAELESVRWDEAGLDVADGVADHLTDGLLYGWRASRSFASTAAPSPSPVYGSPEWLAAREVQAVQREIEADQQERSSPWETW